VGIASKLFELGVLCSNDINVLVTGDTDLSPAIKTFKKKYTQTQKFMQSFLSTEKYGIEKPG